MDLPFAGGSIDWCDLHASVQLNHFLFLQLALNCKFITILCAFQFYNQRKCQEAPHTHTNYVFSLCVSSSQNFFALFRNWYSMNERRACRVSFCSYFDGSRDFNCVLSESLWYNQFIFFRYKLTVIQPKKHQSDLCTHLYSYKFLFITIYLKFFFPSF